MFPLIVLTWKKHVEVISKKISSGIRTLDVRVCYLIKKLQLRSIKVSWDLNSRTLPQYETGVAGNLLPRGGLNFLGNWGGGHIFSEIWPPFRKFGLPYKHACFLNLSTLCYANKCNDFFYYIIQTQVQ